MERKKFNVKILAGILFFVVVLLVIGGVYFKANQEQDDIVYKETEVTFGDLAVGITESGNVTVGITEQEFALDISAFTGTANSSGQQSQGMFGNAMGFQNPSATGSSTSNSETRALEVEEVYIKVGQKIAEGDSLFKLTAESVESIRSELENDLEEAELAFTKLETEEKTTNLEATHTYETNVTYGNAAQLEYEEAKKDLASVLEEAVTLLEEKQKELQTAQEDYQKLQESYEEDKKLLEEAQYLLKTIDIEQGEDIYGYVIAENSREEIEQKVETEEEQLESSADEIKEMEQEVVSLQTSLAEKQKEEQLGNIEAKKSYDTRMIHYNNASEVFNIQTELVESDLQNAQYEYEQAKKKQTDFDSYIVDGIVSAGYSGVITEVSVSAGDTIENKQTLLALNDYKEVSISVDIKEEDMEQVEIGKEANVYIAAFAEENFTGKVTGIGDATVNSSTSAITYPVEVTIEGELSGIYENMTGEVTFTTKEVKEVVQVSNRAINREGSKSYVKIRDENGTVVKKEVETGFSDGIRVEIIEGLSEGDIVLVESKVSDE